MKVGCLFYAVMSVLIIAIVSLVKMTIRAESIICYAWIAGTVFPRISLITYMWVCECQYVRVYVSALPISKKRRDPLWYRHFHVLNRQDRPYTVLIHTKTTPCAYHEEILIKLHMAGADCSALSTAATARAN